MKFTNTQIKEIERLCVKNVDYYFDTKRISIPEPYYTIYYNDIYSQSLNQAMKSAEAYYTADPIYYDGELIEVSLADDIYSDFNSLWSFYDGVGYESLDDNSNETQRKYAFVYKYLHLREDFKDLLIQQYNMPERSHIEFNADSLFAEYYAMLNDNLIRTFNSVMDSFEGGYDSDGEPIKSEEKYARASAQNCINWFYETILPNEGITENEAQKFIMNGDDNYALDIRSSEAQELLESCSSEDKIHEILAILKR